jgi:uncharacterized cupredoxin-like copper-binding protein
MRTRTALIASLLAFALVGAACSGDDDAGETTTTTESEAAAAPSVEVLAVDYGYAGLPAEIAAGTEIRLVNESDTELHEFVAIKLADDDTRSAVELVQLPPEELGALFASVTTVIIAPPNEAGFPVEGTGVLTEPGRYAIICAIPTGADPDEYLAAAAEAEGGPPQVDGGPPHFVQGMLAEVTVVDG